MVVRCNTYTNTINNIQYIQVRYKIPVQYVHSTMSLPPSCNSSHRPGPNVGVLHTDDILLRPSVKIRQIFTGTVLRVRKECFFYTGRVNANQYVSKLDSQVTINRGPISAAKLVLGFSPKPLRYICFSDVRRACSEKTNLIYLKYASCKQVYQKSFTKSKYNVIITVTRDRSQFTQMTPDKFVLRG